MKDDKMYQKLSKWLFPVLCLLFLYALYQLAVIIFSIYHTAQMQVDMTPPIDRDMMPLIMGASTENLLVYAGAGMKLAKLVAAFFTFIQTICYVGILALFIRLLRNTLKKDTPFSSENLTAIRIAIIAYIVLPFIQNCFNCMIIISKISSQYLMNYLGNAIMSFSYILFSGILMLIVVASFQHGLELQQEADETL